MVEGVAQAFEMQQKASTPFIWHCRTKSYGKSSNE